MSCLVPPTPKQKENGTEWNEILNVQVQHLFVAVCSMSLCVYVSLSADSYRRCRRRRRRPLANGVVRQ